MNTCEALHKLQGVLNDAEDLSCILIRGDLNRNAQEYVRKALYELVSQAKELAESFKLSDENMVVYDELPF